MLPITIKTKEKVLDIKKYIVLYNKFYYVEKYYRDENI
jgi:hypothetical protein